MRFMILLKATKVQSPGVDRFRELGLGNTVPCASRS